jgi:hypothetical protein
VLAPEVICAVQYSASSKLRFPRLTVPALDFEVASGESSLSLYSVKDGQQVGIHAFCSFCGMQVLYSPPPPAVSFVDEAAVPGSGRGEVVVNADCLDRSQVRQVHVAYGGARDTPPCVLPHPRSQSRGHPPPQSEPLNPKQYQYCNADHYNQQQQQHLQPGRGVLLKAHAAASLHSDSSGTRALTVSVSSRGEVCSDDVLEDSCSERGGGSSRGSGDGDSDGDRLGVDLMCHLLGEDEGEGDVALQAGARAQYFPVSTQHQHQTHLQSQIQTQQHPPPASAPASSSSLLGSRLLARHQEEVLLWRAQGHSQGQLTLPGHPAPSPSRVLSSSSLHQLGHSPSLYDTIPLMYNYASAASSASTSPLEQHLQQLQQQQQQQHHHSQFQHQADVPVMIRGAELAGPSGFLEQRSRSSASSSHSTPPSASTSNSLHHRLKLYLQQHLDEGS